MLRLEQLDYLVTISKCNSLSEASDRLFITQQSLGKAIKDLEDELGVPLLVRSNKGCTLTSEGEEAVRQGREILLKAHQLKNTFMQEAVEIKGALTILCSQVMFADELPLALESFSRQYSEVTVNAMEKDSYYMPVLHEQLLQKKDEIVISIFHLPQERTIGIERIPERFQFHPIYRTQWLACMNAKNHLAKYKTISIENLLREKIIVSSPDYPEIGLDYAMLSCYGEPQVKKVVSNLELFYTVLGELDNCVGIIPDVLLKQKRASVSPKLVCREMKPKIYSTVGYLVDKAQSDHVITKKFLQHFEEAIEKVAHGW